MGPHDPKGVKSWTGEIGRTPVMGFSVMQRRLPRLHQTTEHSPEQPERT